jgi:hypothetical protein
MRSTCASVTDVGHGGVGCLFFLAKPLSAEKTLSPEGGAVLSHPPAHLNSLEFHLQRVSPVTFAGQLDVFLFEDADPERSQQLEDGIEQGIGDFLARSDPFSHEACPEGLLKDQRRRPLIRREGNLRGAGGLAAAHVDGEGVSGVFSLDGDVLQGSDQKGFEPDWQECLIHGHRVLENHGIGGAEDGENEAGFALGTVFLAGLRSALLEDEMVPADLAVVHVQAEPLVVENGLTGGCDPGLEVEEAAVPVLGVEAREKDAPSTHGREGEEYEVDATARHLVSPTRLTFETVERFE